MFGVEKLRGRPLRLLVTVVCGCAFSLFGYDQALFGGIVSGKSFVDHFNHPDAGLVGQTAAVYDLGCLVGAILAFLVTSKLGHRKTIVGWRHDCRRSVV